MNNFFREMLKCKREIYNRRDRLSADVFSKVQTFVESGSYSACKKADDIAKMLLKGYDDRVIAEHFGLKYDTIRTEKRLISNELWKLFPSDFFEKLLDYSDNKVYIDECIYSVSNSSVSSDDILLVGVLNEVKCPDIDYPEGDIRFEDMRDELDFLLRYSKSFFESDLLTIDKGKVNYIIDVLDGKIGNPSLRTKLIKEFIGESSK